MAGARRRIMRGVHESHEDTGSGGYRGSGYPFTAMAAVAAIGRYDRLRGYMTNWSAHEGRAYNELSNVHFCTKELGGRNPGT